MKRAAAPRGATGRGLAARVRLAFPAWLLAGAAALGAWAGIGGLAVALGPLVGGAIVQGISWQWIFWLNVPVGVLIIPLALARLKETRARQATPMLSAR